MESSAVLHSHFFRTGTSPRLDTAASLLPTAWERLCRKQAAGLAFRDLAFPL